MYSDIVKLFWQQMESIVQSQSKLQSVTLFFKKKLLCYFNDKLKILSLDTWNILTRTELFKLFTCLEAWDHSWFCPAVLIQSNKHWLPNSFTHIQTAFCVQFLLQDQLYGNTLCFLSPIQTCEYLTVCSESSVEISEPSSFYFMVVIAEFWAVFQIIFWWSS